MKVPRVGETGTKVRHNDNDDMMRCFVRDRGWQGEWMRTSASAQHLRASEKNLPEVDSQVISRQEGQAIARHVDRVDVVDMCITKDSSHSNPDRGAGRN